MTLNDLVGPSTVFESNVLEFVKSVDHDVIISEYWIIIRSDVRVVLFVDKSHSGCTSDI